MDEYAEGKAAYLADIPRAACRYSNQLHECRAREMWLAGWDDQASEDSLVTDPLSALYECGECGAGHRLGQLVAFPYSPQGRLHCPRCGCSQLRPIVAETKN